MPLHKSCVEPCDLVGLSDHSGVVLKCSLPYQGKSSNERINFRPITDLGLLNLYNLIEEVDWDFLFGTGLDAEHGFSCFLDTILGTVEKSFPFKSRLGSGGSGGVTINWFTDKLKDMRGRLEMLNLIHRQNPILVTKRMVTDYRKSYRSEVSKSKILAYDIFINSSNNKQKAMWHVIKSQTNIVNTSVGTSNLTANSFNKFFVDVADNILRTLPATDKSFRDHLGVGNQAIEWFSFQPVTYNMVRDKITNLKNSSSKDCYGVNTKMIKTLKNVIIYPLTKLFNQCIAESVFPTVLKIAKVIPIYKNKGSPDQENDYRPISLLPIFGKVFESLLKDQIIKFLETNELLSQSQYGFRNKRSTTLAINELIRYVTEGMEDGLDTYASFFDLTKAFDCVSHDILLSKLVHYNFHPSGRALIGSYLSERTQYVSYLGNDSNKQILKHGVPQGSVLGPLLFLVYINDLPNNIRGSSVLLFADDTTNLVHFNPTDPIQTIVLNQQSRMQDWFLSNKLSLNNSKTQNLNFSLRYTNTDLPLADSVKFLGIHLDPKLTWEQHVICLASKLSRITYMIRNLVKTVSRETVLSAYHGYFGARMCYAILIWGHSAHAIKIFKIQRRCIRAIMGLGYREDCRHCFPELRILTLPSAYILQCLTSMKQNIQQFQKHQDFHDYDTRRAHHYLPSFHRLGRTRGGTDYYCIKFFNVLPTRIKTLEDKVFINKIKSYLCRKAFYSIEDYLNCNFNDFT